MLKYYLITFLVSMIPIVELRGDIPIAVGMGVPLVPAYVIAVIGNMIPVLKAKAGRGLFVALLIFVGIPIPGTGAWTGTLAASLLDMGFKKSVLAVTAGVLLAGIIMGAASAGVFGVIGGALGA